MRIAFRHGENEDFIRVRDMLAESFEKTGRLGNWLIDRWNVSRMFGSTRLGTYETWKETVGIWEDGDTGKVVGVVSPESGKRGEAFFQLGIPLPNAVLEEMFDYAERTLTQDEQDKRILRLCIPDGELARESIARARGYRKLDWEEPMSRRLLGDLEPASLPAGYRIVSGPEVSNEAKALAHAKAFGDRVETSDRTRPLAFARMRLAPDYRPELDLSTVDGTGQIVSFCTMWYDARNRLGVLEPVGTIPSARNQGLARAVIEEGLRRIGEYGAWAAYVGSSMDFYHKLGFETVSRSYFWEKTFSL